MDLDFARDLKLLMASDERFTGGHSERMYDLSEYFSTHWSYDTSALSFKCFDRNWPTVSNENVSSYCASHCVRKYVPPHFSP